MALLSAAADLAADPELTDGDRTIFWALLGQLKYDNMVLLNVSALAKQLGRNRSAVSQSVARLVKAQLIFRGARHGNTYSYQINPDIAWRGRAEERRRMQREIEKRGLKVVDGGNLPSDQDQPLPGL